MILEEAFTFNRQDSTEQLVGIIHPAKGKKGVLIIVGGPQYRVGSHRQFILLARDLAKQGIPVMRFDYSGMGDSDGEMVDFQTVDQDIEAAIKAFKTRQELDSISLWGLCDGASAALFYAHQNPLINGLILLNPWIRTQQSEALAMVKYYYLSRIFSRSLWLKVIKGELGLPQLKIFFSTIFSVLNKNKKPNTENKKADKVLSLPEKMLDGLEQFKGRVLVILSGDDLVAGEFRDLLKSEKSWMRILEQPHNQIHHMPSANHTFSSQKWRTEVTDLTIKFIL